MSVMFDNGELHLPNGQAMDLLLAIGVPGPITTTHGEMAVAEARKGIQTAIDAEPSEPLASNLMALDELLDALDDNGVELLEWA